MYKAYDTGDKMPEGELTGTLHWEVNGEFRWVTSLLLGPLALCSDAIQDLDDVLVTIFGSQVRRQFAPRVLEVRVRAVVQQHLHGVREAFQRGVVQQGAAAVRVGHVRVRALLQEEAHQGRVPLLNNLNNAQYSRRSVKMLIRVIILPPK